MHFLFSSEKRPFDVLTNGGERANHLFELGVPLLRGRQRPAAAPQKPQVKLRSEQVRQKRVLGILGARQWQRQSLVGVDFVVGNLRFDSMEDC